MSLVFTGQCFSEKKNYQRLLLYLLCLRYFNLLKNCRPSASSLAPPSPPPPPVGPSSFSGYKLLSKCTEMNSIFFMRFWSFIKYSKRILISNAMACFEALFLFRYILAPSDISPSVYYPSWNLLRRCISPSSRNCRLRVVPHFSSGIVQRAKRELAWKSPHARKGDTRVSLCLAWGDFHARSRFARSIIPEEKWGTTRSLQELLFVVWHHWCSSQGLKLNNFINFNFTLSASAQEQKKV